MAEGKFNELYYDVGWGFEGCESFFAHQWGWWNLILVRLGMCIVTLMGYKVALWSVTICATLCDARTSTMTWVLCVDQFVNLQQIFVYSLRWCVVMRLLHFVYTMLHIFVCIVIHPWALQHGSTLQQTKHARIWVTIVRFGGHCSPLNTHTHTHTRTSVEGVNNVSKRKTKENIGLSLRQNNQTGTLTFSQSNKAISFDYDHRIACWDNVKYTIVFSSSIVWHALDKAER